MMKKIINYLLIVVLLITSVGGAFAVPQVAHAACNIGGVVTGNGLTDCANEFVVVVVMPIVAKFLQLSAFLFDKAVTLNMDIAKYVQSTASETSPIEVV